jgi:hypothetical protein
MQLKTNAPQSCDAYGARQEFCGLASDPWMYCIG